MEDALCSQAESSDLSRVTAFITQAHSHQRITVAFGKRAIVQRDQGGSRKQRMPLIGGSGDPSEAKRYGALVACIVRVLKKLLQEGKSGIILLEKLPNSRNVGFRVGEDAWHGRIRTQR